MMKRTLNRVLRATKTHGAYKMLREGALVEAGWFRSVNERAAVDREGRPLPWITYSALDFLARRVQPDFEVFEYGSGNSTRWWAERVRFVTSIEHDRAWYEKLSGHVADNVDLRLVLLDEGYPDAILAAPRGIDIAVIDGRQRARCAANAARAVGPAGVLIFDNTLRPKYANALARLAGEGWRRIEFSGIAPISSARSETSIIYRDQNCLGI